MKADWARGCAAALVAGLILFTGPSGLHARETMAPKGPVILTIAGDIAKSNRGALHPKRDGFLNYHEIAFDRAFELDRAMLEALPQQEFEAQLPEGHEPATYSGPRLSAILELAGAPGGVSLQTKALDGYETELEAEDIDGKNWVLVMRQNGRPFGIGGFGPAMLLQKPKAIKVAEGAQWPWAVFYLEVKK